MDTRRRRAVAAALRKAADTLMNGMTVEAALTKDGRATVDLFLMILSSELTQYDKRLQSREPNIYRLGHFFKAADRAKERLKGKGDSDDPADLELLKKALTKSFAADFPPVRRVIKKIDEYVEQGLEPMLGRRKGRKIGFTFARRKAGTLYVKK